jgi:nucleoside-diphosphate-sugar epimerase
MTIKNRILVTGAGGFIGGWLVRSLREQGYSDVVGVDIKKLKDWYHPGLASTEIVGDLRDLGFAKEVSNGASTVYNLAADMGGMGFIENNKALCMLSVQINTNLLIAAKELNVRQFFFASSACVYNQSKQLDPNNLGLKEKDAYPADPEDGYGWEKLFSERMCRHFSEDFGISTSMARFHNVYGPYGTFDGGREKAPAAICRKVARAVIDNSKTIEIWGDGEQTRSFTYIDDTLHGINLIMKKKFSNPINLGSSELVSINQLVNIVEDIAGIKLERRYNLAAPKGVRGRNSDNSLIKEVLNWEPSISLREGLEKTYAWIYDQLRSV